MLDFDYSAVRRLLSAMGFTEVDGNTGLPQSHMVAIEHQYPQELCRPYDDEQYRLSCRIHLGGTFNPKLFLNFQLRNSRIEGPWEVQIYYTPPPSSSQGWQCGLAPTGQSQPLMTLLQLKPRPAGHNKSFGQIIAETDNQLAARLSQVAQEHLINHQAKSALEELGHQVEISVTDPQPVS